MAFRFRGRQVPVDRHLAGEAVKVVERAIRSEVASQSTGLRRWLAALTVVALVGAAAAVLTVPPGAEVFNTSPNFEWGLLIAAYVFFVVTTSGLCLVSSLGMVFGIDRFKPVELRHVALALLFLITGFAVIALELHYPLRMVFEVLLSPALSSPMWWMGVVYAGYLGVLVFELLANLSTHPRLAHAACVISSAVALVAPTTLGLVFGSLVSRPFWQGSFTPIYLIITAILSGASVLGITFAVVKWVRLPGHGRDTDDVIGGIRQLLLVILAIVIGYTAIRTIAAITFGSEAEHAAVAALISGPLGPQSWVVRVGIGFLAPLLILTWPGGRRALMVCVASCLILIGVFVDRLEFVSAGQIAPSTAASGHVALPYATYSPSLDEIAIVLGAVAVIVLVYTLAERFIDLSSPGGPGDVHGIRASGSRSILRRTFGAAR
jgi:Ni/Fe-hydrogenase subunit HybB-like protein